MTLREYSKNIYQRVIHSTHMERQNLLLDMMRGYAQKIHGLNVFIPPPPLLVNTAEHLGVLQFPPFIVSNILTHLFQNEKNGIFSFPTGIVSHGNFSQKRRIYFFDGKIFFFSEKEKNRIGYTEPRRDFALRVVGAPPEQKYQKSFSGFEKLLQIHSSEEHLEDYPSQIVSINHHLWPLLFESSYRSSIPQLFQIPLETMATEMLGYLLNDGNNFIFTTLFDPMARSRALFLFDGVAGAWSHQNGSHFFWGIHNGKLIRLTVEEGCLVNRDHDLVVKLNPENILKALEEKLLVPTSMLSHGIIIFYCGAQGVGGIRQIEYLPRMQQSWMKLVAEFFSTEINALGSVNTKIFGAVGWPFFLNQKMIWGIEAMALGGVTKSIIDSLLDKKMSHLMDLAHKRIL